VSRTASKKPPRVLEQGCLFGGVDVMVHYGDEGHTRFNVLPCPDAATATRVAAQLARAEGARVGVQPEFATCPFCGEAGPVESLFGFRSLRGRRVRQSWCYLCRRRVSAQESSSELSL